MVIILEGLVISWEMTKIGKEPETKCMKMMVTEHEMKIAKGFVMKVFLATNVNVDGKRIFLRRQIMKIRN